MARAGDSIAFGDIEIEPQARRVMRGGAALPLGARGFDVLLALLEQRHRVVSKHELIDRVWAGRVVEENNLNVQVAALRRLLGASRSGRKPGLLHRAQLRAVHHRGAGAGRRAGFAAASTRPRRDAAGGDRSQHRPRRQARRPHRPRRVCTRGERAVRAALASAECDAALAAGLALSAREAGVLAVVR